MTPKIPPKKFMWVPFLRPFPGNEAHKLFSGVQNGGVLGGGQKVYVEKVYVLFGPLKFECATTRSEFSAQSWCLAFASHSVILHHKQAA